MITRPYLFFLVVTTVAILLTACSDDPVGPPVVNDLLGVDTLVVNGTTLELYTDAPLATGGSVVKFRFLENNGIVRPADLRIRAEYRSGNTLQSAPVILPKEADDRGLYTSEFFFTRPGENNWTIIIERREADSIVATFSIPVVVENDPLTIVRYLKDADGTIWTVLAHGTKSRQATGLSFLVQGRRDLDHVVDADLSVRILATNPSTPQFDLGECFPDVDGRYRTTTPLPSGTWTVTAVLRKNNADVGSVVLGM